MSNRTYLTEHELAALRRPTAQASGLPHRCYTDPDLFELELERVFRRTWVGAALSCRVPGPGDALPVEVGGLPLVLVRDHDGALRAFHNACAYDACLVVLAPSRSLDRLRGPYHGFEWDLRGRLVRTPYFDGTPDPPPSALPSPADLVEVACGEWSGLVFVCVSPPARSLDEHLAPVRERLALIDLRQVAPCRGHDGDVLMSTTEVPGNWKIAFENDIEVLHEAFVHAFYASSPWAPKVDAEGRPTFGAVADRGLYGLTAPVHHYEEEGELDQPRPLPTTEAGHPTEVLIADLFPNVQVGVMANHFTVGIHHPTSVGTTRNEIVLFAHDEVAGDPWVSHQLMELWDETRAEDDVVVAATQAGRRTTAFPATFYAPFWDELLHAFHRQVAEEVLRP